MNLVHGGHVKTELDANRIKLLSLDFKQMHAAHKIEAQRASAAETIASALYKKMTSVE